MKYESHHFFTCGTLPYWKHVPHEVKHDYTYVDDRGRLRYVVAIADRRILWDDLVFYWLDRQRRRCKDVFCLEQKFLNKYQQHTEAALTWHPGEKPLMR